MFTLKYETRYGDLKNFDMIKQSALLDMIQDVSIKASADAGYGIDVMRGLDKAWLLQGINLFINKPVKPYVAVEISTAVKSVRGVTSERGCYIKQGGEIVAKAVANWFLFDLINIKPARIPAQMMESYARAEFEDTFFTYKKAPLYDIDKAEYEIRISNKEIDTNLHLNNQKGAELLMDALPFDFEFNNVNVLYKRPAYLGDRLRVCVKEIEKGYYVHLQSAESEIYVAGIFEKI
ncbi:MAG: acyl-ACP thioesterase domain-containing protein [Monoglobales bacterium]